MGNLETDLDTHYLSIKNETTEILVVGKVIFI